MSEPVVVPSFPSNRVEALALAYVQAHITPTMQPEGVAQMYLDAYTRIMRALPRPR